MANSRRRCAYCKQSQRTETMYIRGIQAFCNKEHYIEYGAKNVVSLAAKGEKMQKKAHNRRKKEFYLNDTKTRTDNAQAAFNKFIRLRDKDLPCISCQRYHSGQYHAGHYMPAGNNAIIRFDEANVHKQCAPCNNMKSGNLVNYRIHLINKIGAAEVERLEHSKAIKKYTCDELLAIEKQYKAKAKQLEQDLAA